MTKKKGGCIALAAVIFFIIQLSRSVFLIGKNNILLGRGKVIPTKN